MNIERAIQAEFRLSGKDRAQLRNARVPACLLLDGGLKGVEPDRDGALLVDLFLDGENISAIMPAGVVQADGSALKVDLSGRHVWPLLVDVHTHVDKGHMVERAPDSGGTLVGAIAATMSDRLAHWTFDDLMARMEFGLATAYAHGVAAIRTHLDSHSEQAKTTWAAFHEISKKWGSVALT